mmetsp:Transcript_7234/g.10221  ORF Transcript_7234/g.10221 Transcript_7234/m.10221 type:complete len:89 (+) Transcript_7234:111-377(+)
MSIRQKEENLRSAAISGDITEAKKLIAEGTDVNAADSNGNTALINAASYGHSEVVTLLLDEGAFVEAADKVRRMNGLLLVEVARMNGV